MSNLDIYEVDPWRRGRCEEEHTRGSSRPKMRTKPHTRWPGSICTAKATAGSFGCGSGGLGTEAPCRSCFTPPEAASGRNRRASGPCQRKLNQNSNSFRRRTARSLGRLIQVRTCRLSMMKISRAGQDRLLPAPLLRQAPNVSSFHSCRQLFATTGTATTRSSQQKALSPSPTPVPLGEG